MLSQGRPFGHFLSPTVRHLQKQQNKCSTNARGGGGMRTLKIV